MTHSLIKKTVISFSEKLVQYDLGENHPFRGDRFANSMELFKTQGLLERSEFTLVKPILATKQNLQRVHDRGYIDRIFDLAEQCKRYDPETPVSLDILEAALLICGGAIQCGTKVWNNEAELGVSLGGGHHHAGRNYGGGFCLFNDIAVLIEDLRTRYNVKRFLVLDHDVHFGNGTSDIYCRDPSVLYISLHQDPRTIYPGIGFTWQIGQDEGEGFNINVPLPPGTGDSTYLYALSETFVPLAEEFKPDIIIANGGSDSHFEDTLGNLALTAQGFFRIGSKIREVADQVCHGKAVIMPGSGYNPKILPLCWYALTVGAAGFTDMSLKESFAPPTEPWHCRRTVERTLDELKRLLRNKWICFSGFSVSGIQ